MTNKAWVHVPGNPADRERPFLIPSALQVIGSTLAIGDPSSHYHSGGLPHVKRALVKVALEEWDDPVLIPFREILGNNLSDRLTSFVAACAVYLLAGALGNVRKEIRQRRVEFGKHCDDYMAVNLAIPVADADHPQVNRLFQRVLNASFDCADSLAGHAPLSLRDLAKYVPGHKRVGNVARGSENGPCFIYPEVSAGAQGFVRSRVSKDGIYLFSDTGAATVDQSVFILRHKPGETDMLTYLFAGVLPLGSSHIEQHAALVTGDSTWKNLEEWRKRKETGDRAVPLTIACNQVGDRLRKETVTTLYKAKRKLNADNIERQLEDFRVMFGGGGHVENPYAQSVLRAFDDESVFGIRPPDPDVVGMPLPKDLEPSESISRWMSRLWVAYGLSFQKDELAGHMYPSQVSEGRPIRKHVEIDLVRQEDV